MFHAAIAALLLLNAGVALWRLHHGPTSADRMLAAVATANFVTRTWTLLREEAGSD